MTEQLVCLRADSCDRGCFHKHPHAQNEWCGRQCPDHDEAECIPLPLTLLHDDVEETDE